jgi:hypothetical protein
MKLLSVAIGLIGAIGLSNACCAQIFDNPFSQYVERGVTITPGAGNAVDANNAIQTIDPWPPYVGYTYIPGDGREGVNAVERMYRSEPLPSGQNIMAPAAAAAPAVQINNGASATTGGPQ